MSNYQKVREFNEAIGKVPGKPAVPSATVLQLRKRLIWEEYHELMAEFEEIWGDDPTEIDHLVKEAVDVLYVVYGLFVDCGIDADKVFDVVHKSNMNKVSGGKRRADGKLMKPDGWTPPNLAEIIRGMCNE